MKKLILLIVICLGSQLSFSQDLVKLDFSDFNDSQMLRRSNLEEFKNLATKADVGVAYLESDEIKTYNVKNGIKLIRLASNNFQELNKSLKFSNSVELIIIDILKPNFNLDLIKCPDLKQFKNLKYIYFIYQIDLKNNNDLQKFNCLPATVKQYYTQQSAS